MGPLRGKMNAKRASRLEEGQVSGTQSGYYALIARGVAALDANTPDSRQALYDRARTAQTAQLSGFDPPLSREEMEFECAALEQAIRTVEAEAEAADAEARWDARIVLDFASFLTQMNLKPDCFYDVDVLPHPKEAIIAAIERGIVRSPLEEHIKWLRSGAALLRNFQAGIGLKPLPFAATAADITESEAARPSWQDQRDADRAKEFAAIAEKESQEIEERMAAALRTRGAGRGE